MNNKRIDDYEVATMLGMSVSWVRMMRVKGRGPAFYKFGNAVRYDKQAVEDWIESRKCKSTSSDSYKKAREDDDLHYEPKRKVNKNSDIDEISRELRILNSGEGDHDE